MIKLRQKIGAFFIPIFVQNLHLTLSLFGMFFFNIIFSIYISYSVYLFYFVLILYIVYNSYILYITI